MKINVAVVQTRSGNVLMQVGEDTALGSIELADVAQVEPSKAEPPYEDTANVAANVIEQLQRENAELREKLSQKVE